MKIKFLASLVLAIMILLAQVGLALAGEKPVARERLKIDVLHATGSGSNPYVCVNVSINSVEDAVNVGGHGDHDLDIWTPYTYGGVNYPGQGDQSILTNGCEANDSTEVPPTAVPPTVIPSPTTEVPPTVEPTIESTVDPTLDPTVQPTLDSCQLDLSENCLPTATSPAPVTITAGPTATLAPTATATTPPGCTTQDWNVVGVLRDASGNILTVPGGNFYVVSFEVVKNENGVITRTGARSDFPVFDNGMWTGGGYPSTENLDRLSVTVTDADGLSYQAQAWSIHSTTGQRLADQQQYVGTYCGTMTLEVVISLDDQPLSAQPTPAPLQETGATGFGGWGFLIALMAVGAIGLMALAASNRRAR